MPPSAPPPSPSRGSWLRISVFLLAVMALLALGSRAGSALMARMTLPTGGAEWIWMARDRTDRRPAAFYAVRDFVLQEAPERARLLVLADPEYVLTLNARRLGAGRFQPDGGGAVLDAYEVGDVIRAGGNRLVVELRSDRGAGGFLAALRDEGSGELLVGTDGEWRILARHHFGLVRGWLPLGPTGGLESEAASSWGLPPTGRWGEPREGPVRPRLTELIAGDPLAGTRVPAPPIPGLPAASAGRVVLFDWGREVAGHLVLQVPAGEGLRKALLFTGTGAQPPDPLRQRPSGAVLAMTGRRSWMDAVPRRFRYALVLGDVPVAAKVLPVDPAAAGPALFADGDEPKLEGVFGIDPPPLRSPVEHEIWRELQRVPGVGGGEDL